MKVHQAFRYELDPTNVQRTLFAKAAGTAPFAYNWGLARRIERFEKNEGKATFTNAIEQHRKSLRNLDRAFRNFCRAREEGRKVGFPRFKKKGVHDAFRLTGALARTELSVKLPRIGEVRTKETTSKFWGRILSATVSREADRWFVSLAVEAERPDPAGAQGEAVGIDLGLKTFAALSTGEKVEAPKPLARRLGRLRFLSRRLARKKKGFQNRAKAQLRIARLHRRIRNTRADFPHKLSTRITKSHGVVCIENLNVRGMVRNRSLARAISDAGWAEFRRMLGYKCSWYGSELRVIDRFAPSSKTCFKCGAVNAALALASRVWVCTACGTVHDRDENAATNILYFGMRKATARSAGSALACRQGNACGESVQQGRSAKQEVNTVYGAVVNG